MTTILLANYRFFISGGPERYMFNVTDALEARGHQVIPFSIRYRQNLPTPYSQYFVEPLGGSDEVYFRQQRRTLATLWRTTKRLFYAPEVERSVARLARDTQPQVAYVLHYLRKLSPALLVGLKNAGLPVVVRLSDYAMLCPQAHCLRESMPCDLCVRGNLVPSIRFRCVQHSWGASSLNALATWYHRLRRYFDLVDIFVATNQFMYDRMASAGFPKNRLRLIPTFVNTTAFAPAGNGAKDGTLIYAGRLEPIKGVHLFIQALSLLRSRRTDLYPQTKIVGTGSPDYVLQLKQEIAAARLQDCVELMGEVEAPQLARLLAQAAVMVAPSLWYENLPNAILESYACGTPVLASRLGSLPECVQDGETGFLFQPGDPASLAERLEYVLAHPELAAHMSIQARRVAEQTFSPSRHVAALEQLFDELICKQKEATQWTSQSS